MMNHYETTAAAAVTGNTQRGVNTFARVAEMATPGNLRRGSQRQAVEAADRSRAALFVAKAAAVNKALAEFIRILYSDNGQPHPANIDAADDRILVAVPWGRAAYMDWGLRRLEADSLRAEMLARSEEGARPLFLFDDLSRRWLLNVKRYPLYGQAVRYLENNAVTWRILIAHYRA